MEAITGAAGPRMDPRRQVYADFPATSGDYELDDEPAEAAPKPKTARQRKPRS